MLKQNARLLANVMLALEIAGWTGSFFISYFARSGGTFSNQFGEIAGLEQYLPLLVSALVVWFLWTRMVGALDRSRRLEPLGRELGVVMAGTIAVAIAVMVAIFVLKLPANSRLWVALFVGSGGLWALISRALARGFLKNARTKGYNTRKLVIVGDGDVTARLAATVGEHREWGLLFAGYVRTRTDNLPVEGPTLGYIDDIAEIIDKNVVDDVIFAVDTLNLAAIESALAKCEEAGVNTRIVLDFFPHKFSSIELDDFDGFPMLAFHATSNAQLSLLFKRMFDVTVSIIAILFGAPIFLAVALAVKLSSPGPIFFVQRRVGLQGREFNFYKFRSMVSDAEKRKAALEAFNEMGGPVFKMSHDPRVTAVGRFIRKTSLDELPQFFNILRGEMSIVGPRPPVPSEVAKYERWQRRRLSVKPGLTCIWQVSGRNEIDFETWMRLDLNYIDNWSLWLDLKIFLQTIPAVLFARGAR